MAFVNEYIPEADYEKYDLRKMCGEHNQVHTGHMLNNDWTVDREAECFLIKVWSHRDAEFDGFAFYLEGHWIFFQMRLTGVDKNRDPTRIWISYLVKGFVIPQDLKSRRNEVVSTFERALGDYCGVGIFTTYKCCAATVEYIKE